MQRIFDVRENEGDLLQLGKKVTTVVEVIFLSVETS